MNLNKREMTRHIARNTSLTYAQARQAVDALIEVCFDTLAAGGSIAIDNFLILRVQRIERDNPGKLLRDGKLVEVARVQQRVQVKLSEKLRRAMKEQR